MIVTLTRQVIKRCPYKDETDTGELVIVIDGDAPELHELAGRVDKLAAGPISHENFSRDVASLLPGAQVTTRWRTGPWSVEVSVSALPR